MRAAAIFGLGSSTKDLKPFQNDPDTTWLIGCPATPNETDVILIFGGDGTIHRHLPHLVKLQLPVLVVPRGSGNYFCCSGGVGLDGEIARRANGLPRWLRGHGGYVLGTVPAIFQFAAFRMRILLPRKERSAAVVRSDKPTVLVVFANAPTFGGGMRIAPRALLDDGLLDICVVSDLGKFKLFCLFPTVYFGRHLSIPEVEYFQSESLRLDTETPMAVYADGEYVCQTPIEVSVAPRALPVIVHPSQAAVTLPLSARSEITDH